MSDQWFLDLDGVRSGPYQTSEVMSLIAEGEILPHHQIAIELKSQNWKTILDWRLNQNKVNSSFQNTEVSNFSPAQESITTPIEPEQKSNELNISAPLISTPPITPPIPAPMMTPPPIAPKKRDPMAEMFDILQDTKQKREVKSKQSNVAAAAHPPAPTHLNLHPHIPEIITEPGAIPKAKSSWGLTILIGIVITVLGFGLGQFFQHQKAAETTATTTASPPTEQKELVKPADEPKTEIVDRSTSKMTIRGKVPVNPESAPAPANNAAMGPGGEHKDLQELKDLKKELLELKSMKDEMKNNGEDGRLEEPSGTDTPPQAVGPNGENPASAPNTTANPENPDNPGQNDVHY